MSAAYIIPLFLRGETITDDLVAFETRSGSAQFQAPDMSKYVGQLPLKSPAEMTDLYQLSFDDILDVLGALGDALDFDSNVHLQQAFEASLVANVLPAEMLKNSYRVLQPLFTRENVLEIADSQVGLDYLNGWVPHRLLDGRELRVRAFGSRVLHIPAGNGGLVSAVTILRSVITRSDVIIKAPSNDPLTAIAIARTLADVAPDHPITRHLAVGYWKGGDAAVEETLYQPQHIEKIVAWGGLASVKHVTRYIQPGLELIALDPKRSATIIGAEAFKDDATMREVAQRAAVDIGVANQEGCANARVIYALSGTDDVGLANANRLGEMIYEELMALPSFVSTPPIYPNRDLFEHLESSRMTEDFYRVIGGQRKRRRDRRVAVRRTGRLLADAVGPGRQHRAGGKHRQGDSGSELVYANDRHLPRVAQARAARHPAAVRRAAADQSRLCLQRRDRHAPGCHRTDPAHVQVDRGRRV